MRPPEKLDPVSSKASGVSDIAPYLWIGSTLAGSVLACVAGGYGLDRLFGTNPTFLLVGAGLGLLVVFYHLRQIYIQMSRRK